MNTKVTSTPKTINSFTKSTERIIMYAKKTLKETATEAINKLPDTANIDEIMYRVYLVDKIRKGEEAINNGESISVAALKEEMKLW